MSASPEHAFASFWLAFDSPDKAEAAAAELAERLPGPGVVFVRAGGGHGHAEARLMVRLDQHVLDLSALARTTSEVGARYGADFEHADDSGPWMMFTGDPEDPAFGPLEGELVHSFG